MNIKEAIKSDQDRRDNLRRDAAVTASYLPLVVQKVAKKFPDVRCRILEIEDTAKGSYTTVPAEAQITFELSGNDQTSITAARKEIERLTQKIATNRETPVEVSELASTDSHGVNADLIRFSRIVYQIQHIARRVGSRVRATVGDFSMNEQGISFKLDIREVNHDDAAKLRDKIMQAVEALGQEAQIDIDIRQVAEQFSAPIDKRIEDTLRQQARALGMKVGELPSVPGQDAKNVSLSGVPTGMIYVKSERGGISHNKDEYTSPASIAEGTRLLLAAVWKLANEK